MTSQGDLRDFGGLDRHCEGTYGSWRVVRIQVGGLDLD